MAKLTIEATPPVVQPPPKITLELTPEEAATLAIIGQLIGGHPESTLRGYMDTINAALTEHRNGDVDRVLYRHDGGASDHCNSNNSCIIFNKKTSVEFEELVELFKLPSR